MFSSITNFLWGSTNSAESPQDDPAKMETEQEGTARSPAEGLNDWVVLNDDLQERSKEGDSHPDPQEECASEDDEQNNVPEVTQVDLPEYSQVDVPEVTQVDVPKVSQVDVLKAIQVEVPKPNQFDENEFSDGVEEVCIEEEMKNYRKENIIGGSMLVDEDDYTSWLSPTQYGPELEESAKEDKAAEKVRRLNPSLLRFSAPRNFPKLSKFEKYMRHYNNCNALQRQHRQLLRDQFGANFPFCNEIVASPTSYDDHVISIINAPRISDNAYTTTAEMKPKPAESRVKLTESQFNVEPKRLGPKSNARRSSRASHRQQDLVNVDPNELLEQKADKQAELAQLMAELRPTRISEKLNEHAKLSRKAIAKSNAVREVASAGNGRLRRSDRLNPTMSARSNNNRKMC